MLTNNEKKVLRLLLTAFDRQYSIKTNLENREFVELKERTKKLFDKMRQDIEG